MLMKATWQVWLLGLRIPQLLFLLPRVEALDGSGCTVRIPFGWRSRNHVGSMYLGALCAGADLAAALPAATLIWSEHRRVVPVFADLEARVPEARRRRRPLPQRRRPGGAGGGAPRRRHRRAGHPAGVGGLHRPLPVRRRAGGPLHHGALAQAARRPPRCAARPPGLDSGHDAPRRRPGPRPGRAALRARRPGRPRRRWPPSRSSRTTTAAPWPTPGPAACRSWWTPGPPGDPPVASCGPASSPTRAC